MKIADKSKASTTSLMKSAKCPSGTHARRSGGSRYAWLGSYGLKVRMSLMIRDTAYGVHEKKGGKQHISGSEEGTIPDGRRHQNRVSLRAARPTLPRIAPWNIYLRASTAHWPRCVKKPARFSTA